MRLLPVLAIVLFLSIPAIAHGDHGSGGNSFSKVMIAIDLLRPVDPDARSNGENEDDFQDAKSLVATDLFDITGELAKEEPDEKRVEYLFEKLDISVELLGDLGGFTSPYLEGVSGRSLDSYRVLKNFTEQLRYGWEKSREEHIPAEPPEIVEEPIVETEQEPEPKNIPVEEVIEESQNRNLWNFFLTFII